VQILWKHLPLSIHKQAPAAHAAAEAAHKQGKFWEMHDLIFANQRELNAEKFYEHAAQLGLDVDRFKTDYASAAVKNRVDSDSKEAAGLGVTGTPGFFINGRFLKGAKPFEDFKKLIDEELGRG
jgi:protein-disulfide isomerase